MDESIIINIWGRLILDTYQKVRGIEKSRQGVIDALKKEIATSYSQYKPEEIRIYCAGSFLEAADAEAWQQWVSREFPGYDIHYDPLSLSISCHTGPNAAGIAVTLSPDL